MNPDTYFTRPGVRWSLLRHLRNGSPAHYRWAADNPTAGDTASRRALRAIHCAVLEPDRWTTDYAVYSGPRQGTGWDAWQATHPGVEALSARAHATAERIAAVLHAHPVAGPLLTLPPSAGSFPAPAGRSEVVVEWRDGPTGLLCRGRLDRLLWTGGRIIVADLKTVRSVDVDELVRMSWRMGWHGQLAHYVAGASAMLDRKGAVACLICVEQAPPHDAAVLYLSPALLAAGERERRALIDQVAVCEASGVWPGRYSGPQVLDPPAWVEPEIFDSADQE